MKELTQEILDFIHARGWDDSKQYTPENFMREYYESILLELKNRSLVEYNVMANAKFRFEEGTIVFELENSIVAEMKADAIMALIREVMEERCHIPDILQCG